MHQWTDFDNLHDVFLRKNAPSEVALIQLPL